jgi:phage terminase large subunit-like protein
MISFTTSGYMGDGSPDRADALVWGLTELFSRVVANETLSHEKIEVYGNPIMRKRRA